MIQSKLWSLVPKDFLHGLFIAVLSGVFTVIEQSLQAGNLTFDYKDIGTVAGISALTYISKKFVSNSQGDILTGEPTAK